MRLDPHHRFRAAAAECSAASNGEYTIAIQDLPSGADDQRQQRERGEIPLEGQDHARGGAAVEAEGLELDLAVPDGTPGVEAAVNLTILERGGLVDHEPARESTRVTVLVKADTAGHHGTHIGTAEVRVVPFDGGAFCLVGDELKTAAVGVTPKKIRRNASTIDV